MRRTLLAAAVLGLAGCRSHTAPAAPPGADAPRPNQRESAGPPPAAPDAVRVDPGAPLPARPAPASPPAYVLRRVPESPEAPPAGFNPDPGSGAAAPPGPESPLYGSEPAAATPAPPPAPVDRGPLERTVIVAAAAAPAAAPYNGGPLAPALQLPRSGVREERPVAVDWTAVPPDPGDPLGAFAGAETVPDRWRLGFVPWRRYTSGDPDEMPYFHSDPEFWHYYRQSTLKGDRPVLGPDLFLRLTAAETVTFEERQLPVPSGDSAARPGSSDFFGQSRSQLFTSDFSFAVDFFKGDTAFRPVDWLFHLRPVFNFNHVDFRETGEVSPNPTGSLSTGGGGPPNNGDVNNPGDVGGSLGGGLSTSGSLDNTAATSRNKTYVAVQEAFFEKHLADLSANYDFCAVEVGNQTFNSDFRGFIFNDTNLGARFFGNYDSNRWQYNLAVFDLREKDTNSGLNTFQRRGQVVVVANVYRQDTLVPGYTAELSVLGSFDQPDTQYDTNGFLVRPAPIGTVVPHRVDSYYVGLTGDGHLGRWNVSDALYLVTGRDELNGIAGQSQTILAEMAALELSYDRDWIRYKASFFFASGDHDSQNGWATGFDSIADNTNFTGGPFSYWVRQSFNLGGTSVPLKQRFSLLPDLRAGGAFEGQANFDNPGLILFGLGAEADLTPKLKLFANANYLQFDSVDVLRHVLETNEAARPIGADLSLGIQWRPFLINNVILSAGCGFLLPSRGYRDIYRNTAPVDPGFTSGGSSVDAFLYSAIVAATLTY